mmetsp:Transcript_25457/g.60543  ORF Transcript_25457/g.60543 Transcript_25457/m.60543 type:complete len:215 (-) Transcript_25457:736-1380(-)
MNRAKGALECLKTRCRMPWNPRPCNGPCFRAVRRPFSFRRVPRQATVVPRAKGQASPSTRDSVGRENIDWTPKLSVCVRSAVSEEEFLASVILRTIAFADSEDTAESLDDEALLWELQNLKRAVSGTQRKDAQLEQVNCFVALAPPTAELADVDSRLVLCEDDGAAAIAVGTLDIVFIGYQPQPTHGAAELRAGFPRPETTDDADECPMEGPRE